MALSDTACRTAKTGDKTRKLSDGGGLQLWITPNGSKLWRIAYRFAGKQRLLALGAYPAITLSGARKALEEAKAMLAAGIDPSTDKEAVTTAIDVARRVEAGAPREAAAKAARAVVAERKALAAIDPAASFDAVANDFIARLRSRKRAPATIDKHTWLLGLARPDLGTKQMRDITTASIMTILRRLEAKGQLETVRRLKQTLGGVFQHAIMEGRATANPATDIPRSMFDAPIVKGRAALTEPKAFGELLRAVWSYGGREITRAALQITAYTFARPGEVRAARWSEFDLDRALWTIPPERSKTRMEHVKPLAPQTVAIMRRLKEITGHLDLVFPATTSVKRPLSENTMLSALRRLGFDDTQATPHGFRASASSLLNEARKWHADAIERELAHVERNAVRAAYNRTPRWDERCEMVAWWASECDRMRLGDNVIAMPIGKAAGSLRA